MIRSEYIGFNEILDSSIYTVYEKIILLRRYYRSFNYTDVAFMLKIPYNTVWHALKSEIPHIEVLNWKDGLQKIKKQQLNDAFDAAEERIN